MLDGKAGAAFFDGQPHGAHHEFATELPLESCHTLPHIEGECLGDLWVEIHLGTEARIPEQIVAHAPAGIVDRGGRGEFAHGIESCDVVTAGAVGHIELLPGEAFVQKAGAAGVLSSGFGSDPTFEVGGWEHRKQTRKGLQVDAFVFEGEGEMAGDGRVRPEQFLYSTVLSAAIEHPGTCAPDGGLHR